MNKIVLIAILLFILTSCAESTVKESTTAKAGPYSCLYNDTYKSASFTAYESFFPLPSEFGKCWAITPDPFAMDTAVEKIGSMYGGFYSIDVNKDDIKGHANTLYIRGPIDEREYIKIYLYETKNKEIATEYYNKFKKGFETEEDLKDLIDVKLTENCIGKRSQHNAQAICIKDNYLYVVTVLAVAGLTPIKEAYENDTLISNEEIKKIFEVETNMTAQEARLRIFVDKMKI